MGKKTEEATVRVIRANDLIGALTALIYMLLIIGMFVARIVGWVTVGHWLGLASSLALLPVIYLFSVAFRFGRPIKYYFWLGLMALFLVFELVADQILKVDLRTDPGVTIPYVMFFFAATGGMLGVASMAGRKWMLTGILLYLVMATLAFVQRAVTGL